MLTESEYILQPVQLSKTTRRTLALILLLSLSHSHLSLFLFFSFFCTSARGGRRGPGQGPGTQAISVRVAFHSFFTFLFFVFLLCSWRSRRISSPSIVSCTLSVSLSFSDPSSLFIICFFFTKITEQHQHLFLLKPTPSSAERPTKTEANQFLFLSFIHMYAHTHTYTYTHTYSHIHIKHVYVHPLALISAHACFPIAVSLTFGKMNALRFAPLLYYFVLLNIFFSPLLLYETHHRPYLLIWHLRNAA